MNNWESIRYFIIGCNITLAILAFAGALINAHLGNPITVGIHGIVMLCAVFLIWYLTWKYQE